MEDSNVEGLFTSSVPSYLLSPHFQPKAGCCIHVHNDITCSRTHNLQSSEFSIIWLRFQCHSLTKYICAVYLSPNSSDFILFYWPTWWKTLQLCYPSWPGTVPQPYPWPPWIHAQHSWSFPNFQSFSLLCQIFFSVGLLRSQSYSVTCSIPPVRPQYPHKWRSFCHFNSAKWEDLRQYYSDFPWDDYCFHVKDPSLCAECITEVIVSGMESCIPLTFSNTKAKKFWFNSACSHAVKDREAAYKQYCSHPSPETHALYICL